MTAVLPRIVDAFFCQDELRSAAEVVSILDSMMDTDESFWDIGTL